MKERNFAHRLTGRRAVFGFLALSLVLGACGGVRDTLGLAKRSPDEFTVVRKAPLSMPPDFNLRPPTPGAPTCTIS